MATNLVLQRKQVHLAQFKAMLPMNLLTQPSRWTHSDLLQASYVPGGGKAEISLIIWAVEKLSFPYVVLLCEWLVTQPVPLSHHEIATFHEPLSDTRCASDHNKHPSSSGSLPCGLSAELP